MKRSVVPLAVTVAILLTGCTQPDAPDTTEVPATGAPVAPPSVPSAGGIPDTPDPPPVPDRPGGTFRMGVAEPAAIDPSIAREPTELLLGKALFTGLVDVTPAGDPVPAVAVRWTVNADCTMWTFDLRPGTTFTNGTPVDAAAFQRGWDRAARAGSLLDEVAGYPEVRAGTAATLAGVDASDPARLKVRLDIGDCEFVLRTMHPTASPLPAVAVEPGFGELPVGNGPFRMDGPRQRGTGGGTGGGAGIRLVRNETYGAGPKANLDAVELAFVPPGGAAEVDGFHSGRFDWARVPATALVTERAGYEPTGQWISKRTAGTDFLLVMTTTAPLDSPQARMAVSLAIDRTVIAKGVLRDAQPPATALLPAAFPKVYTAGVCGACRFDPAQARLLAQEGGLTPGTTLTLRSAAGDPPPESTSAWTAAVAQQLEANLGITVEHRALPAAELVESQRQVGASGLFVSSWIADYPSPSNVLAQLGTPAIGAKFATEPATGANRGRYSNQKFDVLVGLAAVRPDEASRIALYKQAEQVAIGEDLAFIPLWSRQQFRLADTVTFGNAAMDFFENPTLARITLR